MRELKLDQDLHVKSMVEKIDVEKESRIPASSGMPTLSKADEPQTPEKRVEVSKFQYWKTGEVLMWTATMTRPEIAYAVHVVARFCNNHGLANRKAVLKVMQLLLHTKKWGITYGGQGCRLNMKAYTDTQILSLPGY